MNPSWLGAFEIERRLHGLKDEGQVVVRNFSQCGKSEHNTSWLKNMLEAQRDPSLFYPDEGLARQHAEDQRRFYQINTPYSPEQVDRMVDWLCHQYSQPRPVNLSPSPLSIRISLITKSM